VIERKDERITGNFDITILDINQLIYSRKRMGQGMCDSDQDIQAVKTAIRAYLESVGRA
jgi:hypothetical protein